MSEVISVINQTIFHMLPPVHSECL